MFTIEHRCSKSAARCGILELPHGKVHTPVFMPVATRGAIKALHTQLLKSEVGNEILLGNTYHLYLRPGTEVIQKAGGLHRFMNWEKPILTDSGGYQIFSLAAQRKLSEGGALFHSHIDGSRHFFTPENVIDIQRIIGADIIMAFDECPPYPCEKNYAIKSMHLTHRWLDRCFKRFNETDPLYDNAQILFPIVQGSTFPDLRKQSAEYVLKYDAAGYAIGGLSVGEPEEMMYEIVEVVNGILPEDKPRYLMGVGTPVNLLENIARGVDPLDCVLPTRNARHGILYTYEGIIHIKNKKWEFDFSPIDANAPNPSSRTFTKAYLRHLFHVDEMMALELATLHNLAFFVELMKEARRQIMNNTFYEWKEKTVKQLSLKL
ncbi:MAG: tRNA guanosine(34) transglycosylase Tgt [Bacteroidia bacterium]|nr:tRNA guanosine(34) transglycosylase Tgt [Bacteroidia bacterium]